MKNKPIETLRDGVIKATIWKNTTDKGDVYNVELVRSYEKDGNWHDTNSLSGGEVLKAANLLTEAHNTIREIKAFNRNAADTPKRDFQESATGGAS